MKEPSGSLGQVSLGSRPFSDVSSQRKPERSKDTVDPERVGGFSKAMNHILLLKPLQYYGYTS